MYPADTTIPAASASGSSSNSATGGNSGSTMTSRRNTASSGSKNSNGAAPKHAASTSSSSSSSSKWKLVRPWQPPSGNGNHEATLEDGNNHQYQHGHDSEDDAAGMDDDDVAEDSASSAILTSSSSRLKRMHLEVVDVSSTSVSLSVFGQPSSSSQDNVQAHHQHLDTSLGSTSSMTNQTTATRRSRAASTSSERILSNPPQPPNISIKLNSAAWPHVFHTDASFFDTESTTSRGQDDQSMSSSSILVWGLSPGQNYHIELGVFEDGVDDDDETAEAEDLSEVSDTEESVRAAASVRTLDATEPDVPPPPYSSHDPSSGSAAHNDAEASLRSMLEKLRMTVKQKESALQSSIASMRRANDKLTREDQRHRQRIHMLEDSTSRLREVAADEDAEHESIREQVEELEETERLTIARLERRRRQQEEAERLGKEEAEKEDAELAELKERLDKAVEKEEEVLAKKLKLERELLPTYNIQLATLEADLRRLVDDHRRRFPYQHHLPPHAFSTHLAHNNANMGHMPANHAAHNARGGGRERLQARAVQHQQAAQQQQQQQQLPSQGQGQGQHPSQSQSHNQRPQMHVLPPKEQSTISSGEPAHRHTMGGTVSEETIMGVISRHRSNSAVSERYQKNPSPSPDNTSGGRTTILTREDKDNDSKLGDTARTGSRFAWSNPNSWASKVAGGGKGGSTDKDTNKKE